MTDLVDIDLTSSLAIHVIGIGGAGMSAIATVLSTMGHRVSGSDLKESTGLERLRAIGIDVRVGHDRSNVCDVDLVAVSTAIGERNPEIRAAVERNIPVLRRADVLRAITAVRKTLAVAGTHGKTTTSSMLALVLIEAGRQPSFIIGGDVNEIGSGAAWDDGELFVVEADESDGTFVELHRRGAIVTNLEADHLEHYGDFDTLRKAFRRFLAETDGPTVVYGDDPLARHAAEGLGAVTYGTAPDSNYRMLDVVSERAGVRFDLEHDGVALGTIQLPVPGAHNAQNAAGAVALAMEVGVEFDAAERALARFGGVARRYEFRGERAGVTFVDDYAHLPTEVDAALDAARSGAWDRVVAVFQPHRYSRTQALWADFADSFTNADLVVITDVYASGEAPRPGVSGKLVAYAILDEHPWARVAYVPRRSDVVNYLRAELRPGDLCLTLGAGDLTSLPDELIAGFDPGPQ